MKRDLDLIRKILLAIEDKSGSDYLDAENLMIPSHSLAAQSIQ